jgi:phosphoribosylpyrophosphate synthetase
LLDHTVRENLDPRGNYVYIGADKGRNPNGQRIADAANITFYPGEKCREKALSGKSHVKYPQELINFLNQPNKRWTIFITDDEIRSVGTIYDHAEELQRIKEMGVQIEGLEVMTVKAFCAGPEAIKRLSHPIISRIHACHGISPLNDIQEIKSKFNWIYIDSDIDKLLTHLAANFIPKTPDWLVNIPGTKLTLET